MGLRLNYKKETNYISHHDVSHLIQSKMGLYETIFRIWTFLQLMTSEMSIFESQGM